MTRPYPRHHRARRTVSAVVAGALAAGALVAATAPLPAAAATVAAVESALPKDLAGAVITVRSDDSPVPAGALHVDDSATSYGNGSAAKPFQTLWAATEKVAVGGTIVMASGTYREGNLWFSKRFTVRSAPGAQVWLKGSDLLTGFVTDTTTVAGVTLQRKDGFTLELARARTFDGCNTYYTVPGVPDCLTSEDSLADRRESIFLDGRVLTQVAAADKVTATSFFIDYAANKLYLGAPTTGHVVESSTRERGITIQNAGADGSVVRGIGMAHYPHEALTSQKSRVLFENNTVLYSGRPIGFNFAKGGAVMRGNVAGYGDHIGLAIQFSDGAVVEGNRIHDNNLAGFNKGWTAAGIKLGATNGYTVRNNVFEGNRATALWLDVAANNAVVVNNTVRNTAGIGIFFEVSNGALIAGNVIENNSTGISVTLSRRARLWNNTFKNNRRQVHLNEYGRELRPDETEAGATKDLTGTEMVNNLMVDAGTVQVEAGSYVNRCSSFFSLFDNNGYYRSDAASPLALASFCGASRAKLTDLQAATVFEDRGIEKKGAASDPFGGKGGTTPVGWPNGAGRALPADVAAALGWPAGVPVSLGANNAAASPSPTPTATPRPTATPSPTATVTPRPSVTPTATATPRPSVTPTATATPRPTATPTVTLAPGTPGPSTPVPSVPPVTTPTALPTTPVKINPASAILVRWVSLGGDKGALGPVTSGEYAVPGGVAQNFTKGKAFWSATTGAHGMWGDVLKRYESLGGPAGSLGLPINDETRTKAGGAYNAMTGGRIMWHPATGAWAVFGAMNTTYSRYGAEWGPLGYPMSGERATSVPGTVAQSFQGGVTYWSAARGPAALWGDVFARWVSYGSEQGPLGVPHVSEVRTGVGGAMAQFANGRVYWHPSAGAHAIYGQILATYLSAGGPTGALGTPTSSEHDVPGGRGNGFTGGVITWDASTGRTTLTLR